MTTTFHCDDCGIDKPIQTKGGTGYARIDDGRDIPPTMLTVCYECCAIRDRASMIRDGRAILYFSYGASDAVGPVNQSAGRKPEITNWPGTLRFDARRVRRFRHPFAREAWLGEFTGPDGKLWRFKNIGDTQIAHCRRAAQNVGEG